jgi:tetratricopeptide (TPR) repeat protein
MKHKLLIVLMFISTLSYSQKNAKQVPFGKENSDSILNQAVNKYQNLDFDGALNDVNSIITSDPNFGTAYCLRGYIYFYYKGDPEMSIKDLTKCLEFDQMNVVAYLIRGFSHEEMGKTVEALLDYTYVITLDKENLVAHYRLGICHSNLEERENAIKDYDYILNYKGERKSEFKDLATVYNNKAYCLVELNRVKEGLPLVNESLKLDESLWYSWDTRGEIYYKMEEFQKCIDDMDHAISIQEHGNSFYYRGLAKIKLGKMTEGCSDLSKSVKLGTIIASDAIREYCN